MKNVSFLVDGFNVYYSILAIHDDLGINCKWLSYRTLCNELCKMISPDARSFDVSYFTAIKYFMKNRGRGDVPQRHEIYIQALKNEGTKTHQGKYTLHSRECNRCKWLNRCGDQDPDCQNCNNPIEWPEEKKTDVNIAVNMVKHAISQKYDYVAVLSGDTDLSPAINVCKTLSPNTEIIFFFPYQRTNDHLKKVSSRWFNISPDLYFKSQFPEEFETKKGTKLFIPPEWK